MGNVNSGAIALGHPTGASGARVSLDRGSDCTGRPRVFEAAV
nr:hypothetical protein [Paenibacillus thiaminolyticus]